MPVINCLKSAKKAYADVLDNEQIESTYDALSRHHKNAQKTAANLLQDMNDFSNKFYMEQEINDRAKMLQDLVSTQAVVDNLQREELFRKAGHKIENSVTNSLRAKMVGSQFKAGKARANTFDKMKAAKDGFYSDFNEDIKGELFPLFVSKEGQVDLVRAMIDSRKGIKNDSAFGRLADIITKYQDRLYNKYRQVGIDINDLDDRIAPNTHDSIKMEHLSRAERKQAKILHADSSNPNYEFSMRKWWNTIFPLLDEDRTFRARNLDPTNEKQMDAFMKESYDNLVNRGKVTQDGTNFATKVKKERVFHWKDAESLIKYNNEYGNGAIQDAILKELANGFSNVELIKDWGTNPTNTLYRTLKVMDENPTLKQRYKKVNEERSLQSTLNNLMHQEGDYPTTVGLIGNSLLAFENITKLGSATLASTGDLPWTGRVGRQLGKNTYATIGKALTNIVAGVSQEEKAILYRMVRNANTQKLGSVSRYFVNPNSMDSYYSKALHWTHKFNLLERWDNGQRAAVASIVSQWLSKNRHVSFDELIPRDQEILNEYGIEPHEWELIRQSQVKVAKSGEYITPDSIHHLDDEVVRGHLTALDGTRANDARVQLYRDNIESKLNNYFTDRMDSAVITPDAEDTRLLSFGVTPDRFLARLGIKCFTQFKSFGVAQARQAFTSILRERGATNVREALFSGKSNWTGIARMAVETMTFAYISSALLNLSKGLSPPELDHGETWKDMTTSAAGIFGIALRIDPKDLLGTGAKQLAGPLATDVAKASLLTANLAQETAEGKGYKKSKKAAYNLGKGLIPYNNFMTKWLANHLFLDALEDSTYPGKRQRDLRHIQQKTGAKQLF